MAPNGNSQPEAQPLKNEDMKTLLFPSDYFNRNEVDQDMKKEYDAAMTTGLFDVLLFGYDEWFNENRLVLSNESEATTDVVYRGWMMTPEKYRSFYDTLLKHNIKLVTSPDSYQLMHAFPNVFPYLAEDTPDMIVFGKGESVNIEPAKRKFGRFMVKDFVKSVKDSSFPKYFDRKTTQAEFDKAMELFYELRGDLFTGGICLKEYVDLILYNDHTNEYRVFYINGAQRTICRNSLQTDETPQLPEELVDKYAKLGSPFYTIDYAERADGQWIIIEAGDGQVSGLSSGQDMAVFYRALYYSLN